MKITLIEDYYGIATGPTTFPSGKIIKCQISALESESFPDGGNGGMLTTDRTPSLSYNAQQVWRPYGNYNLYIRNASTAIAWEPDWHKIESILVTDN